MPTKQKRLALTIPPHRMELLKRLSRLQGVPTTRLVTELLDEFYPVLERVTIALENAKHAQESSKAGLKESAEKAMAHIQPMLDASMQQLDIFLKQIQEATELPKDDSDEEANPRVVTRGSGSECHAAINQTKPMRSKALSGSESRRPQK